MPFTPTRILLAAVLATAAAGVQASSDFGASAAVGGRIGTVSAFDVVCSSAGCFSSAFDNSAASVTGTYSLGPTFQAGAWAQAEDELTLRARAELTVAGSAFAGPNAQSWFANASARTSTRMVYVAPAGTAPGTLSDLQLRYRFDGSGSASSTANVDTTTRVGAQVSAFTHAGPLQGRPCAPDASGFCNLTIPGLLNGENFSYEALLQVDLVATAQLGSAVGYSAALAFDYSHTFALDSVSVTNAAGQPITGWSLYLEGGASPIFSSAVPEPGAAALWLAGLARVARRGGRA